MFGRNGQIYTKFLAPNTGNEGANVGTGSIGQEQGQENSEGATGSAEEKPEDKEEKPEGKEEKPEGKEEKTFTQEDVNNLVSRESKKAKESLLKDLGVEDFDSAKDGLEKYQAYIDSQKSESEKKDDTIKEKDGVISQLQEENNRLVATNEALKQGVSPENLDNVIILANAKVTEDVSIEQAIGKVLEEVPSFKQIQEEEEERKPRFTTGKNPGVKKGEELTGWDKVLSRTQPE